MMQRHFDRWTNEELKAEVVEVKMAYDERGLVEVIQQLKEEEASEEGRFFGRIVNGDGAVTFETNSGELNRVKVSPDYLAKALEGGEPIEIVKLGGGQSVHVVYSILPDGSVVQIGLPLLQHEVWMAQFSRNVLWVAVFALVLSVCAGGFMARRALSPIGQMARLASEISGKSLDRRMPVSGHGDEVDLLAKSFNGMLDRIDTLVRSMREVTDMLAHDLKTPLTGIRGIADVTLQAHRDVETYRMSLYRIIEQLDRLLSVFHTILDVSEVEGGALRLQQEKIQLDELAHDVVQTFVPVAEDKGISLEASIDSGLEVTGDRNRLFQAFANLLDNAVKYTPVGGKIRFLTEANPGGKGAIVTVADTGAGISPKDLPHIFERYYRGDISRSGSGIGLGLPLVQGIVHAHGGCITAESHAGKGTVFRVFLERNPTV
ncbi:MAG: ATP-binding protein [Syntrophobacteraceae bacterium]